MKLTPYEQEMLDGSQGEAKKIAMEVVCRIGKAFGAEELIEISSAQCMAHFGSLHIAGLDWMEKLAAAGGCCCVPTTQDPASISFRHWREQKIDEEYAGYQFRLRDAVMKLGEFSAWSCCPYYQGNTPRFGQNVAWAESSAVSYGNSVLGARTNRTPAGFVICAALTGRMPKYGLYLDENRVPSVKVIVEAGVLSDLDYNTLGILLGKKLGVDIPYIFGIPKSATNENLKYLGASAAASGSLALYHVDGVTPEALMGVGFSGAPKYELFVGRKELEETEASLTTKSPGSPDLAVVGCPHCSASEVVEIAKRFKGRKVSPGKGFMLFTTFENEAMLDRMSLLEDLTKAGVTVMAGTCLVISPMPAGNYKTLITDSGKFASYLPSEHGIELVYAPLSKCIDAVTG